MNGEKLKRPTGLTVICVAWLIFGLINIFMSFRTISVDIDSWKYMSGYDVPAWFYFGVPAELALSILTLCLGLLQIVTVLGLWTGKKSSYKLALIIPIAFVMVNFLTAGLYISAPSIIDLGMSVSYAIGLVVFGVIWAIIYWEYLRRPHVKAFLGVAAQPRTRFYCRYCGAENKTDAIFCEKCGKNIQ